MILDGYVEFELVYLDLDNYSTSISFDYYAEA